MVPAISQRLHRQVDRHRGALQVKPRLLQQDLLHQQVVLLLQVAAKHAVHLVAQHVAELLFGPAAQEHNLHDVSAV